MKPVRQFWELMTDAPCVAVWQRGTPHSTLLPPSILTCLLHLHACLLVCLSVCLFLCLFILHAFRHRFTYYCRDWRDGRKDSWWGNLDGSESYSKSKSCYDRRSVSCIIVDAMHRGMCRTLTSVGTSKCLPSKKKSAATATNIALVSPHIPMTKY
jgi:hypothetical protein